MVSIPVLQPTNPLFANSAALGRPLSLAIGRSCAGRFGLGLAVRRSVFVLALLKARDGKEPAPEDAGPASR